MSINYDLLTKDIHPLYDLSIAYWTDFGVSNAILWININIADGKVMLFAIRTHAQMSARKKEDRLFSIHADYALILHFHWNILGLGFFPQLLPFTIP